MREREQTGLVQQQATAAGHGGCFPCVVGALALRAIESSLTTAGRTRFFVDKAAKPNTSTRQTRHDDEICVFPRVDMDRHWCAWTPITPRVLGANSSSPYLVRGGEAQRRFSPEPNQLFLPSGLK